MNLIYGAFCLQKIDAGQFGEELRQESGETVNAFFMAAIAAIAAIANSGGDIEYFGFERATGYWKLDEDRGFDALLIALHACIRLILEWQKSPRGLSSRIIAAMDCATAEIETIKAGSIERSVVQSETAEVCRQCVMMSALYSKHSFVVGSRVRDMLIQEESRARIDSKCELEYLAETRSGQKLYGFDLV